MGDRAGPSAKPVQAHYDEANEKEELRQTVSGGRSALGATLLKK